MKKIALITGSKGGIGSAISSQLVADGYRVIATYYTGNLQCALDWFNEYPNLFKYTLRTTFVVSAFFIQKSQEASNIKK